MDLRFPPAMFNQYGDPVTFTRQPGNPLPTAVPQQPTQYLEVTAQPPAAPVQWGRPLPQAYHNQPTCSAYPPPAGYPYMVTQYGGVPSSQVTPAAVTPPLSPPQQGVVLLPRPDGRSLSGWNVQGGNLMPIPAYDVSNRVSSGGSYKPYGR